MKKNFALLMVVVLVLGFAACHKKQEKKIGEPVTIEDYTPIKELWRGVVTGDVKTFGSWGIIEVMNPVDDQDHRFTMCVIYKEGGLASDVISRNIKVGTEIYFSQKWVYANNLTNPHPHGCYLGFFHSIVENARMLGDDGRRIINPMK